MNVALSSVSDIFLTIKKGLQNEVSASVVREMTVSDCILEKEGSFLRLRMADFGSVRAIQLLLSDNEEKLALDTTDPRNCMPFLVESGAPPIILSTFWSAPSFVFNVFLSSDDTKRYRLDCAFSFRTVSLCHQFNDISLKPGTVPQSEFDFMRCGA